MKRDFDSLMKMGKIDLQCLCLRQRLSDKGSKAELADRLAPRTLVNQLAAPARRGVCRMCGCTDDHPCVNGGQPCSWVDDSHTLCSACA